MMFVLDSSVTMSWYFADEADPYAAAVLPLLAQWEACTPAIWQLEIANVLLVGERRGRQTEADALRFLAILHTLPIVVDDSLSWDSLDEVLALARFYNLSTYDAAYLELAIRRSAPIATLDERLRHAAEAVGITILNPFS
ncbi:MAG: type II toxin-antitoxin system VapC family toxin [Armatimonadota bacterium]|nr:type II toxin-antitoxin system VapC family toxin [bacterium]